MVRRALFSPAPFALAAGLLACEEPKRPAPTPEPTPATIPTAASPPAKPTLPPTLFIDTGGALVAGARVTLDGAGVADRLKSELEPHREFVDGKEVRLTAERKAKPLHVEAMLRGLGAAGASRVLVRTPTRADYPPEVGFISPEKARTAPRCSVISMILPDRGTATWNLSRGTAGRRGKGMAGPDLTLTSETIAQKAKSCKESQVLFVAGAEGVEWGLVYDLAASTKTLGKAYFAETAVVGNPPVPGHAVELP